MVVNSANLRLHLGQPVGQRAKVSSMQGRCGIHKMKFQIHTVEYFAIISSKFCAPPVCLVDAAFSCCNKSKCTVVWFWKYCKSFGINNILLKIPLTLWMYKLFSLKVPILCIGAPHQILHSNFATIGNLEGFWNNITLVLHNRNTTETTFAGCPLQIPFTSIGCDDNFATILQRMRIWREL